MRRPGSRSTALLLLVTGGLLTLLAGAASWVSLSAEDGLAGADVTVTGAQLVPLATAAGVVGLAAAGALLAVRRGLRVVVAAVVTGVSLLALVQTATVALALVERARQWWRVEVGALADTAEVTTTWWPVMSLAGLACVLGAGVLVLARGTGWAGLSSRYDAPADARRQRSGADRGADPDVWQALDRGEDPTRDDTAP